MQKKTYDILKIVLPLALVFIFAFIATCAVNGYKIFNFNKQRATNERTSDKNLIEWLVNDKHFDIDSFKEEYRIEEITITSSLDGHEIPSSYIYAKGNSSKECSTVIMVHGLLGNRLSNYPMSKLFLDKGFNVITYDQRSSGGNKAPYTTFGFLEGQDALDYLKYANSFLKDKDLLGIWGQSMGAATVENAMDNSFFNSNVDFIVLDSPLGNMEDAIAPRNFFGKCELFFGSLFCKKECGFYFKEQRVYPQIEKCTVPVLVVASTADNSIPYIAQESIYNCIKSSKKLFCVNDSNHSDVYFDHPEEYSNAISEFLSNVK